MNYREQIRSPQWIKLALKLKEDAGWVCKSCGRTQGPASELTIHHTYYIGKVMMWEHPPAILECLCFSCHKERQQLQQGIFISVAALLAGMSTADLKTGIAWQRACAVTPVYQVPVEDESDDDEIEPPDLTWFRHDVDNGIIDPEQIWGAVCREFSSKFSLQGPYLRQMSLESICMETRKFRLMAHPDNRMAVMSIERPAVRAVLESILNDVMGQRFMITIEIDEGVPA